MREGVIAMSTPTSRQAELNKQFELAKSLYSTKQYNSSRAAFNELLDSSYAAKAFYGLGLIEFTLGNPDAAAELFRTVTRISRPYRRELSLIT